MVLCLDGEALTPGFMLGTLLPGFKNLCGACRNALTADQVTNACHLAQEELRGILARGDAAAASAPLSTEAKRRFLARPELGPDRLGLLRVLHDLANAAFPEAVRGSPSGPGPGPQCRLLRVPLAEDSPATALLLWTSFLRILIPEPVSLLLLTRAGVTWLDVLVQEPGPDDFFCLQASLKALPLVTEIPYQLEPDARERLEQVEAKFQGTHSLPPPLPASSAAGTPAPPAGSGAPRQSRDLKLLLLTGGAAIIQSLVAAWSP